MTTEPFPSWLCFAELQYVDGLGELTGAPGGWKVPAHPKPGLVYTIAWTLLDRWDA